MWAQKFLLSFLSCLPRLAKMSKNSLGFPSLECFTFQPLFLRYLSGISPGPSTGRKGVISSYLCAEHKADPLHLLNHLIETTTAFDSLAYPKLLFSVRQPSLFLLLVPVISIFFSGPSSFVLLSSGGWLRRHRGRTVQWSARGDQLGTRTC